MILNFDCTSLDVQVSGCEQGRPLGFFCVFCGQESSHLFPPVSSEYDMSKKLLCLFNKRNIVCFCFHTEAGRFCLTSPLCPHPVSSVATSPRLAGARAVVRWSIVGTSKNPTLPLRGASSANGQLFCKNQNTISSHLDVISVCFWLNMRKNMKMVF